MSEVPLYMRNLYLVQSSCRSWIRAQLVEVESHGAMSVMGGALTDFVLGSEEGRLCGYLGAKGT